MKAEYDSRVLANQQLMLIIIIEARNMYSAYLYFPYQHKLSQQVTSTSRFTIMNMKFRSNVGVLSWVYSTTKEIRNQSCYAYDYRILSYRTISLERPVTKKMTKVHRREGSDLCLPNE